MKKFIIVILFTSILFQNKSILAQIDTTSLSLYPLHTGNYWEYTELLCDGPFICDTVHFSLEVIGDTLLPNDKLYKIILKKSIPDSNNFREYIFERVDSVTANVYRYCDKYALENNEYLIDSLKSEVGDTSKASRNNPFFAANATKICWAAHMDSVLGAQLFIKDFYNITYRPFLSYTLGQNIGLIRYTYYGEVISVRKILKYAIINGNKYGQKISTSVHHENLKPLNFFLYQNYPNPFNPETEIHFQIPNESKVTLVIYNLLGQKIRTLVDKQMTTGHHTIKWHGRDEFDNVVASGVYLYALKAGEFFEKKKMVLMR